MGRVDWSEQVVQFLYGEDGMDGVWVEKQRFDILLMSRKDFRKAYEVDVNHAKFGFSQHITGQRYLTREVCFRIQNTPNLWLLRSIRLLAWHAKTLNTVFTGTPKR